MKKRYLILLAVVAVAVIIFIKKDGGMSEAIEYKNLPQGEPIDIVADFYNEWLDAEQSTTTDPYVLGLDKSDTISNEVKEYIASNKDSEVNPVLCQSVEPTRVGVKKVFESENSAQYMVISRGADKSQRAVVTVEKKGEGQQIVEISCSNAEQAPEREFTFEKEGYLLKSVPPPLNSDYWHIVYKLDGVDGHTAQLFFDQESLCTSTDGVESVCTPDNFDEASKVMLKGQMLEGGAEVKRVEFIAE